MYIEVIKGFLLLLFIFVPLERIFLLHNYPILRPGWKTDTLYFFIGNLIGQLGNALSITITVVLISRLINPALQNIVITQPVWLQFSEAVFIGELGYYTAHRMLHAIPWLWQFHAIHHSVEYMDWLAAVRVHPLDQIFTKIFQTTPLYLLGFKPEVFAAYFLFSAAIAFFIHSNIRLRFSFLKWCLLTPEFHHLHHSTESKAYNKNFAAQLSLIDWLFGTFYLPEKYRLDTYGIPESVPSNYFRQLIYPFSEIIKINRQKNE